MIRKDVKAMQEKDWHPKVPDAETIKQQVQTKDSKINGRHSGSVRMALGTVAVQPK